MAPIFLMLGDFPVQNVLWSPRKLIRFVFPSEQNYQTSWVSLISYIFVVAKLASITKSYHLASNVSQLLWIYQKPHKFEILIVCGKNGADVSQYEFERCARLLWSSFSCCSTVAYPSCNNRPLWNSKSIRQTIFVRLTEMQVSKYAGPFCKAGHLGV